MPQLSPLFWFMYVVIFLLFLIIGVFVYFICLVGVVRLEVDCLYSKEVWCW